MPAKCKDKFLVGLVPVGGGQRKKELESRSKLQLASRQRKLEKLFQERASLEALEAQRKVEEEEVDVKPFARGLKALPPPVSIGIVTRVASPPKRATNEKADRNCNENRFDSKALVALKSETLASSSYDSTPSIEKEAPVETKKRKWKGKDNKGKGKATFEEEQATLVVLPPSSAPSSSDDDLLKNLSPPLEVTLPSTSLRSSQPPHPDTVDIAHPDNVDTDTDAVSTVSSQASKRGRRRRRSGSKTSSENREPRRTRSVTRKAEAARRIVERENEDQQAKESEVEYQQQNSEDDWNPFRLPSSTVALSPSPFVVRSPPLHTVPPYRLPSAEPPTYGRLEKALKKKKEKGFV
ncbi:hypothetical protein JCM3765_005117 [Sporobolomyces pararoseus]